MSASHTSSDPVVKTSDQLYVSPIVGWNQPQRNVIASGEFINPGSFTYYDGMRLSNLLAMAGGLKDDAYRRQAGLVRTRGRPPDSRTVRGRLMINLNRLLSGDPES